MAAATACVLATVCLSPARVSFRSIYAALRRHRDVELHGPVAAKRKGGRADESFFPSEPIFVFVVVVVVLFRANF